MSSSGSGGINGGSSSNSVLKANLAEAKDIAAEKFAAQEETDSNILEAGEKGNPAAAARATEKKTKFQSLADRKKSVSGDQNLQEVEAVDDKAEEDLAQTHQQQYPEISATNLKTLLSSLKNLATPKEIFDEVCNAFPDPSLANNVMDFLIKNSHNDEIKDKCIAAKDLLTKTYSRELSASKNIESVVSEYHTAGLGSTKTELRALYTDITKDAADVNKLYTALSAKYPKDQLKNVSKFLMKSMAFEIKSEGPSIERPVLINTMKELKSLQVLTTMFDIVGKAQPTMEKQFEMMGIDKPASTTTENITQIAMTIMKDKYPTMGKMHAALQTIGLSSPEEKMIVLTTVKNLIKAAPQELFTSARHKDDCFLTAITVLESLEYEVGEVPEVESGAAEKSPLKSKL